MIKKKIQPEIAFLENTQLKVDDGATATTLSRTSCVEPVLWTSLLVEKGRKLCIICFSGAKQKNAKRANLQKITEINSHQQIALLWTKYEHVTVKCTKQQIERKVGSFMRTSRVRAYSAKTDEFTTREIGNIKSSRTCLAMYTQRQLQ